MWECRLARIERRVARHQAEIEFTTDASSIPVRYQRFVVQLIDSIKYY